MWNITSCGMCWLPLQRWEDVAATCDVDPAQTADNWFSPSLISQAVPSGLLKDGIRCLSTNKHFGTWRSDRKLRYLYPYLLTIYLMRNTYKPAHSCNYTVSQICGSKCRYSPRASLNIYIKHQNEGKLWWDGRRRVFQKLLEFPL